MFEKEMFWKAILKNKCFGKNGLSAVWGRVLFCLEVGPPSLHPLGWCGWAL